MNPLAEVGAVCERARQGPDRRRDELVRRAADRRAHDALRRAGRRQRQVPRRRAGHGLRVRAQGDPRRAAPATARAWRWTCTTSTSYMEKTGQWRFTPPTHVMVALAEAMTQFVEEGGQPARLARYRDNCATLIDGMAALGLKPFLRPEVQAPIIVTFHAPGASGLRLQALLRRGQGARLHPLPGQADRRSRPSASAASARSAATRCSRRWPRSARHCARWASPG